MTASYLAQARFSKPYIVVWNEARREGVWYDRFLRLRGVAVSSELLSHARFRALGHVPEHEFRELPAPPWGDRVSPVQCQAWRLFDDRSTEDALAAIPNE